MADVIVRAEARVDMLEIYTRSIEQFGTDVARDYMAGIDRALDRLADYPEMGAKYPGLRPPVRYLTYRRHNIHYDFDGATVWIVRIVHHARDVRQLM
jgi:toxin ParE1/3/4